MKTPLSRLAEQTALTPVFTSASTDIKGYTGFSVSIVVTPGTQGNVWLEACNDNQNFQLIENTFVALEADGIGTWNYNANFNVRYLRVAGSFSFIPISGTISAVLSEKGAIV